MFGRRESAIDSERAERDAFVGMMESRAEVQNMFSELARHQRAKDLAADESLRIALITNEKNAGRVVELAGPYKAFLYGDDKGMAIDARLKGLETAANVGYGTTEETLDAAAIFTGHLSEAP